MITKIYFPRLVIPMASVLSGVVDFALAFIVLIGMMLYYNSPWGGEYSFVVTRAVLALPLFLLLALITALGVSLWLAALNVIYRDITHRPFDQFWLFVPSPIPPAWCRKWRLLRFQPDGGCGGRLSLGLIVGHGSGPMLLVSQPLLVVLVSGLFISAHGRDFADLV
jgi:lipopolysaccharide transport system permease protein